MKIPVKYTRELNGRELTYKVCTFLENNDLRCFCEGQENRVISKDKAGDGFKADTDQRGVLLEHRHELEESWKAQGVKYKVHYED